jgi:transcriptional regulator with XRE-family HTH domain
MKKKETTFQYTPWKKILRQLREEAGLTQQKLALKSAMPQRTIAEYENCGSTRELSIYKIEKILDTLGYEVDVFLKDKS